MDDPLERRIAQDDQDIAVCEHVADAAGEVEEGAGRRRPPRRRRGRPAPPAMTGHAFSLATAPVHVGETEQHGKTAGEMVDVVPDVLGGERAPGRGEQRGEPVVMVEP